MHVLPLEFLKHYGLNCNAFDNYFVGVHRWLFSDQIEVDLDMSVWAYFQMSNI